MQPRRHPEDDSAPAVAASCERRRGMTLRDRLFSPPRRLIGLSFLMDFQTAMVLLAIQYLGVYVLGAPPVVLGLFGTLFAMVYTAGCLVSGSVSDRFGRRRCMMVACACAGTAWLLLPQLGHWRYVLIVVPLVGGALSLFWPSVQAWLAELTTGGRRELTRNLGLFNILWCTGSMLLAPLAAGHLWEAAHKLTFYIPAALLLVTMTVIITTPRGVSRGDAPEEEPRRPHEDGDLFLRLAWIGSFAAWFAVGTTGAMFPKLGDSLGFSAAQVGRLLAFVGAGKLAVFIYTRHEHRWQYRLWPMPATQAAAALALALAALAPAEAVFAASFMVMGAAAGMGYVGSLFYALHGRTDGRGKMSGFHEAVMGSGVWAGPLLGGLGAQFISLNAPFAIAALVLGTACVAQALVVAKVRRAALELPGVNG